MSQFSFHLRHIGHMLFAGLLLACSVSWATAETCPSLFETKTPATNEPFFEKERVTILGLEADILRVKSHHLRQGLLSSKKLNARNAIFIGFGTDGHTYLQAGPYRYDGNFFIKSPVVRETQLLSTGFVIRIEDPSGIMVKNLIHRLAEKKLPRALNCVSGVCTLLNENTQFQIEEKKISALYPHTLLRKILDSGLEISSDGKSQKLEVQVLALGDFNATDVIEKMKNRSQQDAKKWAAVLAGGATLVAIPPALLALILL